MADGRSDCISWIVPSSSDQRSLIPDPRLPIPYSFLFMTFLQAPFRYPEIDALAPGPTADGAKEGVHEEDDEDDEHL